MSLTVLILTYNEEAHIEKCIKSAAKVADEIVVIDSGSKDRTTEIAKNMGAKVVVRAMTDGFAGQRNFALMQTNAAWIFFLDADERISDDLAGEIKKAVAKNDQAAYKMPRRSYVFGEWVKYGGWYPDYCLRLMPRTSTKWEGLAHERPITNLPIRTLGGDIDHYTYSDWSRNITKINSYTTLMAEKMYHSGKRASTLDIVIHPLWAFVRMYIFKRGLLDGRLGFIMAAIHSFYTMMKYVKLFYLQQGKDWNRIE